MMCPHQPDTFDGSNPLPDTLNVHEIIILPTLVDRGNLRNYLLVGIKKIFLCWIVHLSTQAIRYITLRRH